MASSIFCTALVAYRLHKISEGWEYTWSLESLAIIHPGHTFFFLLWNLFLAWIPYGIALLLKYQIADGKDSDGHSWIPYNRALSRPIWKATAGLVFLTWLFFLPNAPYLITDLIHLRGRTPIPYWYDIMVFMAFAWTGLLLGLQSIHCIHQWLEEDLLFSRLAAWIIIAFCIAATGFGVYIGRYLRWNSWDIVSRPTAVLSDIMNQLSMNGDHSHNLGLGLLLSVFLLLAYMSFTAGSAGKVLRKP